MKRALISVSDKTGIIEFAKELESLGFEIISTGGTHSTLENAGVKVTGISEVTGFPECLDGRVKTLHPKIHAGLLAMRSNPEHVKQIESLGIEPIDLVVVNLYPFKQTILKNNVTLAEAIENIDIGGPSMLRSAAKNYQDVSVITDPSDYGMVLDELKSSGKVNVDTNFYLSSKVFAQTAHYDAMIANYLAGAVGKKEDKLPQTLTLTYERVQDMRYGENPHQSAAFYREINTPAGSLTNIVQLHGKELSFNNINDTHGALELLREYSAPTVVACKHSNPCGVGTGDTIYEAFMKAYTSDPVSVFGGIIVCNREVDMQTAEEINKIYVEIVLAPSFSEDALKIIGRKKNIRILTLADIDKKQPDNALDFKKVSGGLLVQGVDNAIYDKESLKVVTKRGPSEKEMQDLIFTWKIVKYVKSNGIAIGKDGQSLGIGCGQVNRIWPTKQAIEHCREALGAEILKGSVLASDAYFPFSDCVEAAAEAGITAIIQPGGSMRDQESIDACDKYGIAMVFTDMRHFRH